MLAHISQWARNFAADWAVPFSAGLGIGVAVWLVWYFTKPACTATAVANGLCNSGVIARFIDVEILLQSGGAALTAGALKGGYDLYMMRRMLNEEREKRQAAERRLAEQIDEQRKRNEEAHRRSEETFAILTEMFNEFREERRQAAEERRQAAEEHRQAMATQEALLEAALQLARQDRGRRDGENSDG